MRVGAYGSTTRQTYGVLGDETNMAARLMMQAEAGQIIVSKRVAELVAGQFHLVAGQAPSQRQAGGAGDLCRRCRPAQRRRPVGHI